MFVLILILVVRGVFFEGKRVILFMVKMNLLNLNCEGLCNFFKEMGEKLFCVD